MKKSKKEQLEVTDSRSYKLLRRKYEMKLSCPLCPSNKGCNSYKFGINNNWKEKRKTQYRNK